MPITQIIIVGAGPSGLLLALLLARASIPVLVLEQNHELDQSPRATHFAPPAVYELQRAGVADRLRAEGLAPRIVCWRKPDGTYIAGMDGSVMDGHPDRLICLPLQHVGRILYEELGGCGHAAVRYGCRVVALGQDEGRAWVDVEVESETGKTKERIAADYVVGCDGANSQIRRSLFGDKNFPGRTWDEQIVATNTYYDFDRFGWEDSNFIVHPEDYYMAARISKDGMWRITYGDTAGLSREELLARQPAKFEKMLPGNPKPDQYNVVSISPYRIHQRMAEKMRVGRFLLAADAAHLVNPFGGMGLMSGIVDVGGLYDCLVGIHEGKADETILDKYNDVRQQKWRDVIDPISCENLRRLWKDAETVGDEDEFLLALKRIAVDAEFSDEFHKGMYAPQHDFTQYYRDEAPVADAQKTNAKLDVGPAADSMRIMATVR
ncbi:putative monooxygenase fad-binding protein [Diplodia seriata]|uniref:Putative monooxygenase fad-binding protein n=1 Tax=Diplodia seriata TaxID=420778 RepID=A0A0G2DUD7_9PEZI|nr:putative monooxygenase fad-binding protein [Diplodia seriata]